MPLPLRLAALAALLIAPAPAQAQSWLWALGAGGPAVDEAFNVAADSTGAVYVTGSFRGTVTFGPFTLTGPGFDEEIYLAKFSPAGEALWALSGGGPSDDVGYGLAVDPGGDVYLAGRFQETAAFGDTTLVSAGGWDFFLARYSPEGELRWIRGGGGGDNDEGFSIALDPEGNVYATGLFFDTATFGDTTLTGAGGRDVFLLKYAPDGDLLWARSGGGPTNDIGYGVASDATGNAYATGRFSDVASFGPFDLTSAGSFDIYLVKYSPDGDVLWAQRGGSAGGGERGYAVAVDADGNAYLTGKFQQTATFDALTLTSRGDEDVFLVKYAPYGEALWGRSAGGMNQDTGRALLVNAAGDVYLTGRFQEAAIFGDTTLVSAGHHDVFLARYSPEGDLRSVLRAGGIGADGGSSLSLDAVGNAYVAGYFSGAANFGLLSLASRGAFDLFLAKFGPSAGVLYPISAAAVPESSPLVIGHGGGDFSYRVTLTNSSAQPQTFQMWTAVTGPVGREPVLGPLAVTLPAGGTSTWSLTQSVPSPVPAGMYRYHIRLGIFPAAFAGTSFTFEKLPSGHGAPPDAGSAEAFVTADWEASGWDDATTTTAHAEAGLPNGYTLSEPHPNPFGVSARLTLRLAEAQRVTAEVLDALGRRVAVLHDGPMTAGDAHPLVVEAGALPSGLYVVRVTGERFTASRRLALVR